MVADARDPYVKKTAPSLEDLFEIVSAVSFGRVDARVAIPDEPQLDDMPTRLGVALNVLLDDLSARARITERMADRLRILAESARGSFPPRRRITSCC